MMQHLRRSEARPNRNNAGLEPLEPRRLMAGTGLTGQYYNNEDFTSLAVTRTDPTVNFSWGYGSPDAKVAPTTFSARWTGQIEATATGSHTFYTSSDNRARLWVNGQLVIDDWASHAERETSGTIALTAGQKYDIKMDFVQGAGLSAAKLLWATPTQSKQIIPTAALYATATAPAPAPEPAPAPAPLPTQAVTSFTLMNADTNQPIGALSAGQTLDLAALPTRNLSVRANTNTTVGSVMFGLDGVANYHSENTAPYSLNATTADEFNPWNPSVGSHTIKATPYSGSNSSGTIGTALTVTFNVTDSAAAPAPAPAPEPEPAPAPAPNGVTYEHRLSAGQSLSSIAPKPGDDVLLSGNWSKINFPWSGTSIAPVHVWFDAASTVGNGQSGTVLQGGTYLHLHGLRVTGVTNGLQVANAAAKIGTGTTLSDSVIENTTGTGLGITGSNILVQRTTFQRNGQQGFVIINSNGVTMRDSKILYNNPGLTVTPPWAGQTIDGYTASYNVGGKWYANPDFEGGGNKIWASNNVRLENNEAAYNTGPGLWTDYKNTNITMTGNWLHDNRGLDSARAYQGEGIRLELSPTAGGFSITNNRTERNSGAGITLTSVRDVDIRGNRFTGGMGVLFRNDDGRGALTNITVTANTFVSATITTWGNRFPMTNVTTAGNTFI